jgi:GNAT superfamily N-acetyltransferase
MTERIREIRGGADDAGLGELWQRVFGAARGGQTLEWLFRPGPAGPSIRSVFEIDGRIVAHAGVVAIRFRLDGEDVRGAYSVGAMTDPACRGRGLWTRTGKHLYACLEREGFAFVAGFSNANSHRLMSGPLGRTPVGPFPWCIRFLSPLGYVRSLLGRFVPSAAPVLEERSVRVTSADFGDPRLDEVWKHAADASPVACVRDAAFTAWRYASRPDAGYRLLLAEHRGEPAGFLVQRVLTLRRVRAAFLLDFVLVPGEAEAGPVLLRAAAKLARAEGALLQSALLPGAGPTRTVLRRSGFLRIPERLHPQLIRFSVRGLGQWANRRLLVEPDAWHLSWADTDVV